MVHTTDDSSGGSTAMAKPQHEWRNFLLLMVVGLPASAGVLLVIYGFLVWFSQLLFFGPPT